MKGIIKKYFLGFIVAVVALACNNAQDSSYKNNFRKVYGSGVVSGAGDSTAIKWETTYFDLGVAKRGSDIEVEFPFINTGDKPLVIDSVNVTCGCTLFSVPDKPIMPGKEGQLKIKFVSSEQPLAIMEKHIYIKANTKGHPYHTLAFKIELTK